ncbi:MAG: putative Ig domain-containing protein, partial [Clostridiales bacterium]|nr:putative Ig domain-containing protein [Clostridiales bacterium]
MCKKIWAIIKKNQRNIVLTSYFVFLTIIVAANFVGFFDAFILQQAESDKIVRAGNLVQQGDKISGLDSTWMWSNDNMTTWITGNQNDTFKGDLTVYVATTNFWADAKIWQQGTYLQDNKVVYQNKLWKAKYWTTSTPSSTEWDIVSETKPTPQYTFIFSKSSDQQILQNLENEKLRLRSLRKVFAYMPSWGVYDGHDLFDVKDIKYDLLTHITYSFLKPVNLDSDNPTIQWDDPWAALGNVGMDNSGNKVAIVQKIRDATKKLKDKFFVFSVGGWTYSEHGEFEKATSTPQKINAFAQNIVNFMLQYDFDGIDIDWEYPMGETYAKQFLELHKVIREKLTAQSLKDERYYQLSCATTPNKNNIQWITPTELIKYCDTINYMAYDYHGGSFAPSSPTNHNAPMFPSIAGGEPDFYIDIVAKEYLKQGVPANQLLMGLPLYTRVWYNVENTTIHDGYPGLGVVGYAPGELDGKWGYGCDPYYTMEEFLTSNKGYQKYWDSYSKVPYLYSPSTKIFHSFDDGQSIQNKVDFILQNNFAGAILWDLTGDTRVGRGTSEPNYLGKIIGKLLNNDIEVNDDAKITTSYLSNAQVGVNYNTITGSKVYATGTNVKFSLSDGPSWASISTDGQISGVPSSAQSDAAFTVVAKGSSGVEDKRTFHIEVKSQESIQITTNSLSNGIVGEEYSLNQNTKVEALGNNVSFTLGDSPSWASISANGQISGKPTAEGNVSITVIASGNNGAKDQKTYSIQIIGQESVQITTNSLSNGMVGEEYSLNKNTKVEALGNNVSFMLGDSPSWASISADGQISGKPTAEGNINITVIASGNNGAKDQKTYSIEIIGQGQGQGSVQITTSYLPDATVGEQYGDLSGTKLMATGNDVKFSLMGGPVWLVIGDDGQLRGVPDKVAQNMSLVVKATSNNGMGTSDQKVFEINVKGDS